MLRLYSQQRRELREFTAAEIPHLRPAHDWTDYPIGVAVELSRAGFPIAPANLLICSSVPEGSGLSSSAALEVAAALALLGGRVIPPLELALLCQRAERTFVGMPCGIMDQYISIFGRPNSAVEIDCRSLDHRFVPLPGNITFMAVNSMVKHALAGSAYKDRVAECAAAAESLGQPLRDLSPAQFESKAQQLSPLIARRARHVVTENARVADFVDSSIRGDLARMGRLMVESHRSLQHDYEVSCQELDFLVDTALSIDGVYGSRMTGGGFGGCTVSMLRPDAQPHFEREIVSAYQARFHVTAHLYPCHPSAGAGEEPAAS
jgi:galactokinase